MTETRLKLNADKSVSYYWHTEAAWKN